MFKEGNLVRRITDDGNGEILKVVDSNIPGDTVVRVETAEGIDDWVDINDLELVAESQAELDKTPNPQPMEEQTVAIVSFEGAVKREVKAIREALKLCDTLSEFQFTVTASGPINSGEVKISYRLSKDTYGSTGVKGNNVKECLAEFLRRHGWDRTNKPIAISYDGIPT